MLTLEICPHEASTLVTTLVQRCSSLEQMLDSAKELHEEVIEDHDQLQAELDGMNAGAQLDNYVEEAAQGVNALLPQFTTLASNLAEEMRNWESELSALLRSHADIGSVDIHMVSTHLEPFAARVANWRNSIETIINNAATQEA
jgi:HPt (histidine-containing phosphotransfer) domain-containing protein